MKPREAAVPIVGWLVGLSAIGVAGHVAGQSGEPPQERERVLAEPVVQAALESC